MKRHLLTVLTVMITLTVLVCSLATWPSIERKLECLIYNRMPHLQRDLLIEQSKNEFSFP